jgi:hypothetical protein
MVLRYWKPAERGASLYCSQRKQGGRVRNEFFGDINDYRKYGLLRILSGGKRASSAICWMLTPDMGKPTKVDYLCRDKTWRHKTCWHFDERLFDALHQAVCVDRERNVARAKHADILSPEVFDFYEGQLKDDINSRKEYFEGFLTRSKGRDLVFFDPDTGLEIKGAPYVKKRSPNHLYFDELSKAFDNRHSVLVFQFFTRRVAEDVINEKTEEIFRRLRVDEIASFTTPGVIFLLIPQREHLNQMKERSGQVQSVWGEQIQKEWHSRARDGRAPTRARI